MNAWSEPLAQHSHTPANPLDPMRTWVDTACGGTVSIWDIAEKRFQQVPSCERCKAIDAMRGLQVSEPFH